jgi:hypothetical protein
MEQFATCLTEGEFTMAYDMNAEGINGVQQTTYLVNNTGGGGWTLPPPLANGSVLLFVNGTQGGSVDLAGVQAMGNGKGAGIIGQTSTLFTGPGVGVAGYNVSGFDGGVSRTDGQWAFNHSRVHTAGVYGECDNGGIGVQGQGGDAIKAGDFPNVSPMPAGVGVLGVGGKSAPASSVQLDTQVSNFPAQAAGTGVIGLGGDATAPDDNSGTGVVGMGAPAANTFAAARGGIFGSAGNVAQVQLIPAAAPRGTPNLPATGRPGDLYVTVIGEVTTLFLCTNPGDPTSSPAVPPIWAPIIMGPGQIGGNPPVAGKTYP